MTNSLFMNRPVMVLVTRRTAKYFVKYDDTYHYYNIIILSSHRLPSTMSAMDSRILLRKNIIINSKTTSATVDTIVNTNQVDFLFSLVFT